MKRFFLIALVALVLATGCNRSAGPVPVKGKITLSTTTSTQDSGLLDFLLPVFTGETGWEVDVVAVGSGAALRMGRDGDADVLLVHARPDEIQFVADGYGAVRHDVMYNDFLIVGPDSATIVHNDDVINTLRIIAEKKLPFVSRGDDSGTHRMELALWRLAGIDPGRMPFYSAVGQGMGATLQIANEMCSFTLTDRATWLALRKNGRIDLSAVCEGATGLLNYYGVILVNPALHPHVNVEGGRAFVDWMTGERAQKLIGEYGVEEFGEALFTANAN